MLYFKVVSRLSFRQLRLF